MLNLFRMYVHRHNSLRGCVAMSIQHMVNIQDAPSTFAAAKERASEIEAELRLLADELKQRDDTLAPDRNATVPTPAALLPPF